MTIITHPGFSQRLDKDVIYLRRYARALTGSCSRGDKLADGVRKSFENNTLLRHTRLALFSKFHEMWRSLATPPQNNNLPLFSREVFIMHCLEDFSFKDVGAILDIPVNSVKRLFDDATADLQKMRPSRILLVEDETLIAMDMSNVIADMGHVVVGIARTKAEAVAAARNSKPDLITCDIKLADGSSGIDAIEDIMAFAPDVAVVFLTGFPEELLTGSRSEPAFVIDKPYREKQLLGAIAQSLALKVN